MQIVHVRELMMEFHLRICNAVMVWALPGVNEGKNAKSAQSHLHFTLFSWSPRVARWLVIKCNKRSRSVDCRASKTLKEMQRKRAGNAQEITDISSANCKSSLIGLVQSDWVCAIHWNFNWSSSINCNSNTTDKFTPEKASTRRLSSYRFESN